jgi:hypothetical protein
VLYRWLTVKVHITVSELPYASTTLNVTFRVPTEALAGVPEITPVALFRDKPCGSEPAATENV